ncbi:MAG: enoyl-CoA hydratase/isomerase family protein [Acidobacteria bacterium]|nr:enoyl-CoA hydratase/isomerase family protein [Acidobacteriota bacterium]
MENVKTENRDGVLVVTIDRPKSLNALNAQTIEEIAEAFDAAKSDASVKAVILTGGGEKAFVAGADISELATMTPVTGKATAEKGQKVFAAIERFPKPVIAAINGFALGGGCELALACHIRIASQKAQLGLPEVSLGIIPGYGGTQRMARLLGKGKALELILTGDRIGADEALAVGLVNRVVAPEELMATAEAMAKKIASRGQLAVRAAIEAVMSGSEMPQAEGQLLEATLFGLLASTDDMREGMQAFLEKRAANFQGK